MKENATPLFSVTCIHKDSNNSELVRHFGLHVLEYMVKFRWNDFQQNLKEELKQLTLQLIQNVSFFLFFLQKNFCWIS